jgi:hypothetical protein
MKRRINKFWKFIDDSKLGLILLALGVGIGIGGFLRIHHSPWSFVTLVTEFYANISTELISIAITILIIDALHERRHNSYIKAQLIRQMSHTDHGFALLAVEELRLNGWLFDGTMAGSKHFGAKLAEVDFSKANLKSIDLRKADLERANLFRADLRRANLKGANLRNADLKEARLEGADLKGADLRGAHLKGVRCDRQTEWPDGFLPEKAGIRLKETPRLSDDGHKQTQDDRERLDEYNDGSGSDRTGA